MVSDPLPLRVGPQKLTAFTANSLTHGLNSGCKALRKKVYRG
jgi:hypothetical protein